jgi:hypothetical protein
MGVFLVIHCYGITTDAKLQIVVFDLKDLRTFIFDQFLSMHYDNQGNVKINALSRALLKT